MALQSFLETRQVFTTAEFSRAFPDSQTDRNLLSRAVGNGRVERVRRGVYVSKVGPFIRMSADPFDIAAAVAEDAVFAYTSALQLHGTLHNLTNRTQFFTKHRLPAFTYDRQDYVAHQIGAGEHDRQSMLTASGRAYRVTTREQTLVDCLTRPRLAGGPENVLRSLAGFAYLNTHRVAELAQEESLSARARIGWVLQARCDAWSVPDETLSTLRGSGAGPSYFWSSTPPKDSHWVNDWKLYLPAPEEEMAAWLNG